MTRRRSRRTSCRKRLRATVRRSPRVACGPRSSKPRLEDADKRVLGQVLDARARAADRAQVGGDGSLMGEHELLDARLKRRCRRNLRAPGRLHVFHNARLRGSATRNHEKRGSPASAAQVRGGLPPPDRPATPTRSPRGAQPGRPPRRLVLASCRGRSASVPPRGRSRRATSSPAPCLLRRGWRTSAETPPGSEPGFATFHSTRYVLASPSRTRFTTATAATSVGPTASSVRLADHSRNAGGRRRSISACRSRFAVTRWSFKSQAHPRISAHPMTRTYRARRASSLFTLRPRR